MRYEYAQFSSYMRRVFIVAIQQLSQARKVLVRIYEKKDKDVYMHMSKDIGTELKPKIKDIYMHMSKDIGTELKPQRG